MEPTNLLENLIFIAILILFLALVFYYIFRIPMDAPFVPTGLDKMKVAIKLLDLKDGDVFYDLGSGDGRTIIYVAKTTNVAKAVGYEKNPVLVIYSRIAALLNKTSNVEFVRKDLYKADLSECNKLFLYILPAMMKKLEEKIVKEMPKGSIIVSNTFSFPTLKLVKEVDDNKVYIL